MNPAPEVSEVQDERRRTIRDLHLRPAVGLQGRISRCLGARARPKLSSEFRNLRAQLNLNQPYHLEQEVRTLLPTKPPEDAPEELKAVWPLVRMWAGNDATARGAFVDSASNEDLEKIMGTVDRLFPVILSYLERQATLIEHCHM